MRVLALFPLLCLVAAFIISMLALFAGSKIGFLEQYDLLTLNTSQIGQVNIAETLAKIDLPAGIKSDVESFVSGNEDVAQQIVHTIARELNIHDWYAMHVLDYCEGYYEPSPLPNATDPSPSKNTTFCANTSTTFNFNITQILESELRAGTTLADLDWPTDIQNAIDTLNYAIRAMFILYCIGIGLTGLAMIGAFFGFFANGVLHAWLNALLDLVAFLAIGIASALATAIATIVVNAVNQYGSKIGVAAYRGTGFLALTWVATALVLLAMFTWIFDCCAGRRRDRRRPYKV